MDYRQELQRAREAQRVGYVRFREITALMMKHQLVSYNKDRHCYEPISPYYYHDVVTKKMPKYKLLEILKQFTQLQRNIQQQAMLLLELEHAIEHEAKRIAGDTKEKELQQLPRHDK